MKNLSNRTTIRKNFFETTAWQINQYVCGIDEVGRGSLAGPLVVCAALLPIGLKSPLLKDSKVLSQKQRETACFWLYKNKCKYSLSCISPHLVDQINIYQATLIAMKKAYTGLLTQLTTEQKIKYIVTDAMPLDISNKDIEVQSFPKAESLSISVAAASIIAKVERDRIMDTMEKHFPIYNFSSHKGYGTKSHTTEILKAKTPSIIHRKTFIKNIRSRQIPEKTHAQQQIF